MALTVGTDTYITLTDATTYLADFGAEGATVLEADLKKATLAIDRLYGSQFSGSLTSSSQSLLFPRDGSSTIPKVVAQATAELASMLNGGFDPYAQPDALLSEETIEVDVLKTVKKYIGGYRADAMRKISMILSPVLAGSSAFGSMPVVRG